MGNHQQELDQFMTNLRERNPSELEFHQAVEEVAETIMPWYLDHKAWRDAKILERVTEPDRIVSFRVIWEDDQGEVQVNRAWRVQFNQALGPYKGGLRFNPSVNQSILKFLGFEQIFKNSLTGLSMGGAKGGSNFNPRGRSDREVMRFCQSLMTELNKHIGADIDIPAGDIGVGAREISYLFGQYVRLENRWEGVLTGKGYAFGGSAVRAEATGYGCMYFCEQMHQRQGKDLNDQKVLISGSGNVAIYAAEKGIHKGCKVLTLSDSGGFVHFKQGMNPEHLAAAKELKFARRGRLAELAEQFGDVEFHQGKKPWAVPADIAMPCATQNEVVFEDAKDLVAGGVKYVSEGANMPVDAQAMAHLKEHKVLHAPGKASNAGGVAVSGLEMSQNSQRLSWSREEVDHRLQEIMQKIHASSIEHAAVNGNEYVDYAKGANIAGFQRVADVMLAYGYV